MFASFVFPMVMFSTFGMKDFFDWLANSSATTPLYKAFGFLAIWLILDVPFTFLGAYRGFHKPLALQPDLSEQRTPIPSQPWHQTVYFVVPLYGLFPFATISVQFKYMMDSAWRSNLLYAMFGILLVNIILLIVTLALVSVIQTYRQLAYRNYDWWWRSFFIGASGGFYMFCFSMYYLVMYMNLTKVLFESDAFFVLQMTFVSFSFAMMCGAITLASSYLFIERIYNASKNGDFTRI